MCEPWVVNSNTLRQTKIAGWNMEHVKMYFLHSMGISHCHVGLQEGVFCSIFEWLRPLIFTFHAPRINEMIPTAKKGAIIGIFGRTFIVVFFCTPDFIQYFFGGGEENSNTHTSGVK